MVSFWLCACIFAVAHSQPEQIHLSYGYDPSQMTVVWSTPDNSSSTVLYGLTPYNLNSGETGVCWEFTEDNPDGLHYVHKVVLKVKQIPHIALRWRIPIEQHVNVRAHRKLFLLCAVCAIAYTCVR